MLAGLQSHVEAREASAINFVSKYETEDPALPPKLRYRLFGTLFEAFLGHPILACSTYKECKALTTTDVRYVER